MKVEDVFRTFLWEISNSLLKIIIIQIFYGFLLLPLYLNKTWKMMALSDSSI
ncbi:hypothetical protein DB43_FS00160 [Parachlamydia acanthamoebae]|uniref:Uncharacterized protein n=1 Tax=Parachlamydia acanthamoebae TaxID=83552 RepID=A0A0C1C9R7_9BACT|nr:hypothetical protein DB43_FS00160 [Parachlamydia acanthamoebae]